MLPQKRVVPELQVPFWQLAPPTQSPSWQTQSPEQVPHETLPPQPLPISPQYCPPGGVQSTSQLVGSVLAPAVPTAIIDPPLPV